MEFVNIARYKKVKKTTLSPFSELRKMKPLRMTQNLEIVPESENLRYADQLAERGETLVNIIRDPEKKNFKHRTNFPRRVLFEMTSRCNFACTMCPQWDMARPHMDTSVEVYKRVLDELDHHGIESFWNYHFGEQLLHKQYDELVKYLDTKKNLGIKWTSTNGQLLTEEKSRLLLNSSFHFINFSAHAVTAETYKKVSPTGKFETVQGNLMKLYELKGGDMSPPRPPFIRVQMVEQASTKHEVDPFLLAHYQKADVVSVNMLEYVDFKNNSFGRNQRERAPLTSCARVSSGKCSIFSNGALTFCDNAYDGQFDLGNINEQSVFDIWNGTERKKILELNKGGRMAELDLCKNCGDYDLGPAVTA